MTLTPPFVKSSLNEGVLRLTLSRPERRNVLSVGMLGALNLEFESALDDPCIRVVVLAAEGPVFCAGHDLKELTLARENGDGGTAFFQETFALCERLMLSISLGPKPVIAEVQGLATAAGCQLVAACDMAVASTAAQFATPGVNIGLFCTTPSVPLVRTLGSKRARHMLFSGEPISARQALDAGLVSELADAEVVTDRAMALARAIAAKPAAVVQLGKAALARLEGLSLKDAYATASEAMVRNLGLSEAKAGIAAFFGPKGAKPLI